jgi:hypothetical protein
MIHSHTYKWQNQWQYWILTAIFCCCSWSTASNWFGHNFNSSVILSAHVKGRHFLCHKLCYQIVHCWLIWYFPGYALLNASQTSSKLFQWEGMFQNQHAFHRNYTMFTPIQHLCNWCKQQRSNKGDLNSSVTGEVWRVYYMGVTSFWFNFCAVVRDCCLVAS